MRCSRTSLALPVFVAMALHGLCLASRARAAVVFSEVFYNPPDSKDTEYVEIHNPGEAAVDLSAWTVTGGIEFVFPAGSALAPGGYAVVCRSVEAFRTAYPEVPVEAVFGEFAGSLANEGDQLVLADATGSRREEFVYDDDSPWDFLADGFGASLERVCVAESPVAPWNWRASRVPSSPEEHGGTPGAPPEVSECPPTVESRPRVLLSEIHYHPFLEESLEDRHEFVEIHNAGPEAVPLDGWRLAGGIEFAFPPGSSISPGEYLVIAKDRAALAAVPAWGLDVGTLRGDYERSLDDGGDKVAIISASGQGVDSVSYDDDFPWPASADALGAGISWLPTELQPFEDHRYKGRSLERISFEVPAGAFYNWAPSPLDGATPGRTNASARPKPLPAVAEVAVLPTDAEGSLIRAGQSVLVTARFEPEAPAGAVEIDWFVDDVIHATAEPPATAVLRDDGQEGDLAAGDRVYSTVLPGRPDNTLVRYRIRADLGEGSVAVSPHASHPNPWDAWFVSPVVSTTTRLYQILISPANWGTMWTNIQGGRTRGCAASPTWDAQVPAVFIHEGRVYDARVRYQGSRWNRANGRTISRWTVPGPAAPRPLLAMSWRIAMPRYNRLEGKEALMLNKLTQGCPGYNAGVGYRLFEQAGIPAPQTRFVRLHINGAYYHYMLELERPGEDMIRRYNQEQKAARPDLPPEPIGHLFKSMGFTGDEGPWGWGDERALLPSCGHTKEVRYQYTYERKTHDWDTHAELIALIEDLNQARARGREAVRTHIETHWDVEKLLAYVAIMNWSVPFDDMFQNHFLYQRLSDGKWFVIPWDLDQNFGVWKGAQASLYMGQQGDADNRSGWWNYLKDAILRHYREEYEDKLLELNNTVLHPENVFPVVDAVTAQSNQQEASAAPAGVECTFAQGQSQWRTFTTARFALVNARLAGVEANAGPDQRVFAGQTVQFDASASKAPADPEVTYTWDNGMSGVSPTFVFLEPGRHEVTLTITFRGIAFRDSVTITVLPIPETVYREAGGSVVMEAEGFFMNDPQEATDAWWEEGSATAGYAGRGYMEARFGTRRQTFSTAYAQRSPELRWAILFEDPGDYRVWVRALAPATESDSLYVGLDGVGTSTTRYQDFSQTIGVFGWSGSTRSAGPQILSVPTAGLHVVSIWIRETGTVVDRILLTKDLETAPTESGPPESPQDPYGGHGPFVRGDADSSGRLNVTDAVAILLHLFGSKPIACEDHGDTNDSGSVEIADAVQVLSFLFQRGDTPATPFPQPGYDPTEDAHDCGAP